jgi:hypothetical protein
MGTSTSASNLTKIDSTVLIYRAVGRAARLLDHNCVPGYIREGALAADSARAFAMVYYLLVDLAYCSTTIVPAIG